MSTQASLFLSFGIAGGLTLPACFYQAKSRTSIPDTATFETHWWAKSRTSTIPDTKTFETHWWAKAVPPFLIEQPLKPTGGQKAVLHSRYSNL